VLYQKFPIITMGRTHNADSGSTSLYLTKRAKEARVNGKDWGRIQQMYQSGVVEEYRRVGFADRGLSFGYVLNKGLLRSSIERHGLFRSFNIYVRAYRDSLPDGSRPWLDRGVKLVLTVHPEDPDFFARLSQHVSDRFSHDSDRHFSVALVSSSKSGVVIDQSTPAPVALSLLMNSPAYDFVAVVGQGLGERRAIAQEFVPPRRAKLIETCAARPASPAKQRKHPKRHRHRNNHRADKNAPIRQSLEERDLPAIAHQLTEQIASEMSRAHKRVVHSSSSSSSGKKSSVKTVSKKLIGDQLFVSKAVQAAVLNDSLYKVHGAAGARDYYGKRNINIGQLINDLTVQIQSELKGIDPSPMFKRESAPIGAEMGSSGKNAYASVLSEEASEKIFHSAVIGVCLLDKFKEWSGYYGSTDDGGPDQGPSSSLKRSAYRHSAFVPREQSVAHPPVHARAYCDHAPADEPEVVEESGGGPSIISQSVFVRRSGDHHDHNGHSCNTHRKHYDCHSGSESSSSDEEERLIKRAHRKKHGGGITSESSASSGSDSDDHRRRNASNKHAHEKSAVRTPSPPPPPPEKISPVARDGSEEHGNFLKVLGAAKIHFETPCLVLAPHNSVFNDDNLEAVLRAVKSGKKSYKDFALNYIVKLGDRKHFDLVCSHQQHVKLVSQGGVVFEVDQPGRRLLVARKYASAFKTDEPRLRLSDKLFSVGGYPEHVQFLTLKVLHQSFPRKDQQ
jgi:hypothetical protein